MKKLYLLFIVLTTLSCDLFLNEQDQFVEEVNCDEIEFFVVVENMPILHGGLSGLQQKVAYPEAAKRAGIEGRVTVEFIVSETGSVLCPKVIRGIGGGCNEAALDAVSKAKFSPGMQNGKPVKVQYSLPIVFRLQN